MWERRDAGGVSVRFSGAQKLQCIPLCVLGFESLSSGWVCGAELLHRTCMEHLMEGIGALAAWLSSGWILHIRALRAGKRKKHPDQLKSSLAVPSKSLQSRELGWFLPCEYVQLSLKICK